MDEHSLIKQAQRGEKNAWDELVRCFMKDAYYFSLRLTGGDHNEAEEISQDAFVQVYRYLNSFREEVPFKNWLYKIITNLFINRRKKTAIRKTVSIDDLNENLIPSVKKGCPENQDGILSEELNTIIHNKMNLLPERQKAVLVLHTYEGLKPDEIAETLNISYESAKMNLSLARKRMREELKGYLK